MNLIATLATDGYKLGHKNMFPEGTSKVYSTWTPRSGKHLPQVEQVVAFGFQGALKEITKLFDKQFFSRPKEGVIKEYSDFVKEYLFLQEVETQHFEDLHDLGYLPIEVKALEEGTLVPFRVPMMTVENTDDRFFWLTNYLETLLSALLWKPSTTASIARVYRQVLDKYAIETTGSNMGVEFQAHDFSMRGMSGPEDAGRSGVGHLLFSVGTDTLPAITYAKKHYNADSSKGIIGCSVAATEHSLMCAGTKEGERETYRRLIEDIHPTGILSIVSDTWNLWNVLENIIPSLKDSILARDGREGSLDKVVIRPDSGNPVDILCGDDIKEYESLQQASEWLEDDVLEDIDFDKIDSLADITKEVIYKVGDKYYKGTFVIELIRFNKTYYEPDRVTHTMNEEITLSSEQKGVIELLWDTFGGTVTEQGYKVLNPKIGAIYGDSITIDRAREICERLKIKGFASTNVVLGIGSYTYQMITRDSLGFAMKATSVTVNGEERAIFKDPVTDDGTKKSAKGRVTVYRYGNGVIGYEDQSGMDSTPNKSENLLQTIYKDGKFVKETSLEEIRERLRNG